MCTRGVPVGPRASAVEMHLHGGRHALPALWILHHSARLSQLFVPALVGLIVAATANSLAPRMVVPLPSAMGRSATDVAWESADGLLIATGEGVHRYSLRDRTVLKILPVTPLPDGLPDPMAIASDGTALVAASSIGMGGAYAMQLRDRKRIFAQRGRFMPLDASVRGQRVCLLAFQFHEKSNEAVWCGALNEGWSKYKPVHRLRSGEKIFRDAWDRFGGAIAVGEDGSLAVITSAEPGVFRYAPDGTLIETTGQSFDQLVLTAMREMRSFFAGDVEGGYRLILNTQPIIDDLVLTPRGPAIVVRIAEKERTRWELWWPRADGRTVPPTRLGIDRIGPFGHIQCDARGSSLACVGSKPDRKQAADFHISESAPYLWIFELPK